MEMGDSEAEDFGWKLIHGDVFRFPAHRMALSAFVGVGVQFLSLAVALVLLGIVGLYYPHNRGSMKTSGIIIFALTSRTYTNSHSIELIYTCIHAYVYMHTYSEWWNGSHCGHSTTIYCVAEYE